MVGEIIRWFAAKMGECNLKAYFRRFGTRKSGRRRQARQLLDTQRGLLKELENLYDIIGAMKDKRYALLEKRPYSGKMFYLLLSKNRQEPYLRKGAIKHYSIELYMPAVARQAIAWMKYTVIGTSIVLDELQIINESSQLRLQDILLNQLLHERELLHAEIKTADHAVYHCEGRRFAAYRLRNRIHDLMKDRCGPPVQAAKASIEQRYHHFVDSHEMALFHHSPVIQKTVREILNVYKILSTAQGQRIFMKSVRCNKYLVVVSKTKAETNIRVYWPNAEFGTVGFAKLAVEQTGSLCLVAFGARAFACQPDVIEVLCQVIKRDIYLRRRKHLHIHPGADLCGINVKWDLDTNPHPVG